MKKFLLWLANKIYAKYEITKADTEKLFSFNNKIFKIISVRYDSGIDRVTSIEIKAYDVSYCLKNRYKHGVNTHIYNRILQGEFNNE